MGRAARRNSRIFMAVAILFFCAASFAFASDSSQTVWITPQGSDRSLPIEAITKENDNVKHLGSFTV